MPWTVTSCTTQTLQESDHVRTTLIASDTFHRKLFFRISRPDNTLHSAAAWDPYMLPACRVSDLGLLGRAADTPTAGTLVRDHRDPAVLELLRILHTLDPLDYLPAVIPFELTLLNVQTRHATSLGQGLSACKVTSETVAALGLGLWKTQHVMEEQESLTAQTSVLQEGLQGKSTCFLITFFRKVLDDTSSDIFHAEILELLQKLVHHSDLAAK